MRDQWIGDRWINQLNEFYKKIVADTNIPTENLEKANKIIIEAIEKLRPLTQRTLN